MQSGTFRTLTPVEAQVEEVVSGALSHNGKMIQYLVEPHEGEKRVHVVGAADDAANDRTEAVRAALAARGFGEWAVTLNIKDRKDYFPQAA